jgi:hypothetical protein
MKMETNRLFRDQSAWYHIVVAYDSAQSTSSNRLKLYVNGEQETSFSSVIYPSQSRESAFNSNRGHEIGRDDVHSTGGSFDGYMAEWNFVDGQALAPTSLGETGDYGEWKPIEYSGSYGTTGFHLDFETSGTLGNDANGSNNWTTSNLASTDQMLDSPTNNFCTLNPLDKKLLTFTFTEGNLKHSGSANGQCSGTFATSTGKYYYEHVTLNTTGHPTIGVVNTEVYDNRVGNMGESAGAWSVWTQTGSARNNATTGGSTGAFGVGDILNVAYDVDAGKIWFGKNNTWEGSGNPATGANATFTNITGEITPAILQYAIGCFNFGQDSSFAGNKTAQSNSDGNGYGDFYYTPPSGFLALCSLNLPDVAVIPSEHFNTVLYTGNGGTQSITGVNFEPSLTWIKSRSASYDHVLTDSVRGVEKQIISNKNDAESQDAGKGLTSFDSDGFTVTLGTSTSYNNSSQTYVAWNWKANGVGVTNTTGSITSTVSANVNTGFSIVQFSGSGSAGTVGHGLSKTPEMVINKPMEFSDNTNVYHHQNGTSDPETDYLILSSNSAPLDNSTIWNDTAPSGSVFTVGGNNGVNQSGKKFINYVFHSVDGCSKVGSYKGNGSTDGTFVYLGFRPAFIMVKNTSGSEEWVLIDNDRHPYNDVNTPRLLANRSNAESEDASIYVDYTSNGFKIRATQNMMNTNGSHYTYLAFAESPFKHTNAK